MFSSPTLELQMKKSEIMEVTKYKAWESIKIPSLCSGPKPLYLQHFWQTPEGDTFISNSQSQGKKKPSDSGKPFYTTYA